MSDIRVTTSTGEETVLTDAEVDEFRCAEIGTEVYSGMMLKKLEGAKTYSQFHRDYVRKLPDEMSAWMVVRHAPPLPVLPSRVHGKMVVVVPFVSLGQQARCEELIEPVRRITGSHGEAIGMDPWIDWRSAFDGLVPHGARNHWKSHHLKDLSDECIDKITEYAGKMPSDEIEVLIPHMEGAPSRIPESEAAYAHRKTPLILNIHTRCRALRTTISVWRGCVSSTARPSSSRRACTSTSSAMRARLG